MNHADKMSIANSIALMRYTIGLFKYNVFYTNVQQNGHSPLLFMHPPFAVSYFISFILRYLVPRNLRSFFFVAGELAFQGIERQVDRCFERFCRFAVYDAST